MLPQIKNYLASRTTWQAELTELQRIIQACELDEGFKWKHPCYSYKGKNIVMLFDTKAYCGISFFKGVLLKDPENILVQQTENMQSDRQIRFTGLNKIQKLEPIIKQYVQEAIAVERSGKKVPMKTMADYEVPQTLQAYFSENLTFKEAFYNLTPGRQRGYLLYFSQPKQANTKVARIEKNAQRILDGYGLNDCTCGLSKRKPNCDGSHKQLVETSQT